MGTSDTRPTRRPICASCQQPRRTLWSRRSPPDEYRVGEIRRLDRCPLIPPRCPPIPHAGRHGLPANGPSNKQSPVGSRSARPMVERCLAASLLGQINEALDCAVSDSKRDGSDTHSENAEYREPIERRGSGVSTTSDAVRDVGTNTPSTENALLPVPHKPTECQVSVMVTCSALNTMD